jgi:HTH-type transcriptional regulator/antitoxin HigA
MEALIDGRAAADLARHFSALQKHVPLRPVRNDADYRAAVTSLNGLLDAGAGDENHPLADLAATLGELIGDYDDAHFAAKPVAAVDMLRHLMEAHGLKQGDLPEIGSQGVVSEVLRGRRELNLRQIRGLARRFSVPAAVFIVEIEGKSA